MIKKQILFLMIIIVSLQIGFLLYEKEIKDYFSNWGHDNKYHVSLLSGEVFILSGTLVDYKRIINDGVIVIQNGKIAWEGKRNMLDSGNKSILITNAYIYPGFLDTHNHPSYDFLPKWRPKRKFVNRYQWAGTKAYHSLTNPRRKLMKKKDFKLLMNKIAEVKAIISGTTMIQGARKLKGLSGFVRELDSYPECCKDMVSSAIHPLQPREKKRASRILDAINKHREEFHLIHLGEGTDEKSKNELYELGPLGLLRKETVIIHGTAFGKKEFEVMKKHGMNLIWSPMSNYTLYKTTTRADWAAQAGLTVALAPDWSITGSDNILEELKFAWKMNKKLFNGYFKPKDLFEMITINPAKIFNLDKYLGSLQVGKEADLVVIAKKNKNPFINLLEVSLADVLLVTIHGELFYGQKKWFPIFGKKNDFELLNVDNKIRALDITEDKRLPLDDIRYKDILKRFANEKVKVLPLAQGVSIH
jgi:5-methylthioadenosine/S-adenosylhomocysteine deaminase